MLTPADLGLPATKFPAFRTYGSFDQLSVATEIATCDERFVLLSSPPGSGKSLMYMTAAALTDARVLVLVGTKGLQDQVVGDFGSADCKVRAADVRGHRNYACMSVSAMRGAFVGAADDSDPEYECGARDSCGYRRAIDEAGKRQAPVTNYALWMALARFADPAALGEFDVLVCDEGHTTPEWLTSACAVEITRRDCRDLLRTDLPSYRPSDLSSWAAWARDMRAAGKTRLDAEDAGVGTGDSNQGRTAKEIRRLRRLIRDLGEVAGMPYVVGVGAGTPQPAATSSASGITRIEKPKRSKVVMRGEPNGRVPWVGMTTDYGVKFTPIWGTEYAERYLFRGIPKLIVCSGTLVPEHGDQLGISRDPSIRRWIEVPSSFPAERRPLWYVPTVKVDHKMTDGEWRVLVNKIDRWAETRTDLGKGIVHSQSYDYAKRLAGTSRHRANMVTHDNSAGLRAAIQRFDACEWGVLVSPSIREGFDFKGDRARWGVILKVPQVDSRDPLTAARLAADSRYRYVLIAQSMIQMVMRIIRSEDDYGEWIIFDKHWGYMRDSISVPAWFRASWRVASDVPTVMRVGGGIRMITSRKGDN